MTLRSYLPLSILLLLAASRAQANLITNGSFESGKAVSGGGIVQLDPAQPSDLPGWSLQGGTPGSASWAWYMTTGQYGTAQDGGRFINVTSPSLSQAFSVTAGIPYNVSYYEALRADAPNTTDTLLTTITVAAGSASGTLAQTANHTLKGTSVANWKLFTFTFTPDTNTTATLKFALSNGAGYPLLDNVSVDAAVPEPSSLALGGLGLLGVLLLAARRRCTG